MALSAAQRSKIRRLSQPVELSPDEEGGELNIVPFLDIIVNILIFVLATVSVTFTATIDANPPASGSGGGVRSSDEKKSLNLAVFIVDDGFSIKTSGGNIAPGCDNPGSGITVPKKGEQYDFAGLKACAKKLKHAVPEFEAETQVSLVPEMHVPFQVLVQAMDSLRCEGDLQCTLPDPPQGAKKLFPDISFRIAL